jgi:hypothetical protein
MEEKLPEKEVAERIKTYRVVTFTINADPIPEPVHVQTQKAHIAQESLPTEAIVNILRESSSKLAPSVAEYDYDKVVSANDVEGDPFTNINYLHEENVAMDEK